MRQILANVLRHELRRYRGTQKRDIRRELSIEESIAQSSCALGGLLAVDQSSPSQRAQQREEEVHLAEVLGRLPDDYREVIIRRNMQMQTHDEIARAMNRTPAAVRMLWIRTLKQLKAEMCE